MKKKTRSIRLITSYRGDVCCCFFCPIKLRNQTESIFHFQMMYIHTRSTSIFTVVTHFLLMFYHLLIYDSSSKNAATLKRIFFFFLLCQQWASQSKVSIAIRCMSGFSESIIKVCVMRTTEIVIN